MLGVALAIFAHEIRTPLTGILAVSDLLATSSLGERERRWAQAIKASADHLASLTTLFIDAAQRSPGRLVLQQERFDLMRLVSSLGESLTARAEAKGLSAAIHTPDALPQFVVGDRVRLRAALENLIDNAVKFTNAGNIDLTVRAAAAAGTRVSVTFEIADRGIGLDAAQIRRLFKPFSQASLAVAQRFGGAGLGLSSARLFAKAMGGDVVATPRDGGGAVFRLTAALTTPQDAAPAARRPSPQTAPRRARPLRVLAVEDNPYGRVVLNAILTELGHQVAFAGRGEEAVAIFAKSAFDVVLMDMILPGQSGLRTIAQLREASGKGRRPVIIGVSGRDADASAALAAGADAFLVKPVEPRLLAQALAAATAPRRPRAGR